MAGHRSQCQEHVHSLLPYTTVFLMISGEASYDKVAEAAESALDGYLLKPYTASALGERLKQARHRKRELGAIFGAAVLAGIPAAATDSLQLAPLASLVVTGLVYGLGYAIALWALGGLTAGERRALRAGLEQWGIVRAARPAPPGRRRCGRSG